MNLKKHLPTIALAVLCTSALLTDTSFAADEAETWLNPLADGANSLSKQLVNIGAPILGLCIAGYGGWATMTGRVEWGRLWMFLIGGSFIGIGPSFAAWFMSLLSGAGS